MRDLVRRRWPVVLVAGWSVLLLVLAVIAAGGDATVAAQRGIAESRTAMDKATIELVNAVGGEAAVRVGRFDFVADCEISVVRDGVTYRRLVELYPEPGGEQRLMQSLVRRLPAAYRTKLFRHRGTPRISGHADPYLPLTGSARDGVVRIEIATECHPPDGPVQTFRTPPTPAERAELAEVLELTGGVERKPQWRTEAIACGTGDAELRAVTLAVTPAPDRALADAADLAPPDAQVLARGTGLLAYRRGAVSVVAEARGGTLTLTTTTVRC
ncbi:MAG: hypothetical protein ACRDT4_23925 [Micromonosporaceae bacterium]